ncbi:hypothetical protein A3D11_01255 [Candidatus Peribacteria bacterium RIFCSPHIGHO2_02_FULL_49_16]|nr:MAG: hypothetical protein A2880_02380 [Candidatus Peribacteria bacterium RIFCSPHIGHO2_01_FULL_49_38]OGJ59576.1 MAG: hypothetical protein A3D11_01255 [Candidatus Peribacteria bacterium RIFCSPHIGHO2_02_FULL_49_16]
MKQNRLLGGALVLALTQFGASLAGLVRDRILAQTFPGLGVVDVYIAAFRPSDLLFQIFIMAGFSTVLVPLLARYKAHEKQHEMWNLLQSVITIGFLLFGFLALVSALLLPYFAHYLTNFTGQALSLYISFARLALLINALFVFGNAFGQYLITIQRYWIYGLTPIIYTGGTIFGTIFLTPLIGPFGPIYGTLLGALVYVLLRFITFVRSCPTTYNTYTLIHPDLRKMGILMLPRMAALGALQFQLLFFDKLASGLGGGSVTVNSYARNFQAVIVGIIGVALAQSAYSALSQKAAKGEWEAFRMYLKKGSVAVIILGILGAIGLSLTTPIAAWLVHLSHVLPIFGIVLMVYAISIPFESLNHLLLRSYYALHRTGTPAIFTVCNGFVAILISWFFLPVLGVFSLPLGFTAGQIVQTIGLGIMLPRILKQGTPTFK